MARIIREGRMAINIKEGRRAMVIREGIQFRRAGGPGGPLTIN